MPDKTTNMLKIGEAAKRLGTAVETIRMYEREGLVLTHKTATGQRLYSESDLHWLDCIRRLIKEQSLNIEGIRRLLALIPCWDIKPCSAEERRGCPAYLSSIKPCWHIKSELPGGCREADCRACPVYQSARECTNLKTLRLRYSKEG